MLKSRDSLLDFLRLGRRLTGTKAGCAEVFCGAGTVRVGHLQDGALHYLPVNACIRFTASLDGCHVVTVEHLSPRGGPLHPVQQAMVDHHGSQCGFCTPGIIMALYALWMQTPQPDENQVKAALQGNLCRCTGYAPIIRAALCLSEYGTPAADAVLCERNTITERLKAWEDHLRVEIKTDQDHILLPGDVADLAQALACILYTSDAADDLLIKDLGGRRNVQKKKKRDEQKTKTSNSAAPIHNLVQVPTTRNRSDIHTTRTR